MQPACKAENLIPMQQWAGFGIWMCHVALLAHGRSQFLCGRCHWPSLDERMFACYLSCPVCNCMEAMYCCSANAMPCMPELPRQFSTIDMQTNSFVNLTGYPGNSVRMSNLCLDLYCVWTLTSSSSLSKMTKKHDCPRTDRKLTIDQDWQEVTWVPDMKHGVAKEDLRSGSAARLATRDTCTVAAWLSPASIVTTPFRCRHVSSPCVCFLSAFYSASILCVSLRY